MRIAAEMVPQQGGPPLMREPRRFPKTGPWYLPPPLLQNDVCRFWRLAATQGITARIEEAIGKLNPEDPPSRDCHLCETLSLSKNRGAQYLIFRYEFRHHLKVQKNPSFAYRPGRKVLARRGIGRVRKPCHIHNEYPRKIFCIEKPRICDFASGMLSETHITTFTGEMPSAELTIFVIKHVRVNPRIVAA